MNCDLARPGVPSTPDTAKTELPMRRRALFVAPALMTLLGLALAPPPARAGQVVLSPVLAGSWVYLLFENSYDDGAVFSTPYVGIEQIRAVAYQRSAFLGFDLSGIPAGDRIIGL